MTGRREQVEAWLRAAIDAVDPAALTMSLLSRRTIEAAGLVAIGKAGPAMSRGAVSALGRLRGICVTSRPADVPEGIDVVLGDHPVPGRASFEAGERLARIAEDMDGPCLALISGGGSALCEHPIPGVTADFLAEVTERLVRSGAAIDEVNMVRGHLSAIKHGGLAEMVGHPVTTMVLSDVPGCGPEVVASGPTIPSRSDPEKVIETIRGLGMAPSTSVQEAIRRRKGGSRAYGPVHVVGDGRTAASALAGAAHAEGVEAHVLDDWLLGSVEECLETFLAGAGTGVTVGVGEPGVSLPEEGPGSGGRNTHAAVMAAMAIEGRDWAFAAMATDGIDGSSGGAGAIVDGDTVRRGGDPTGALSRFDTASYLRRSGDLLVTGPTETNVADLWVLWRL